MKRQFKLYVLIFISLCMTIPFQLFAHDQLPTSAPMTTDLAGRSGNLAISSVVRVLIPRINKGGTAFYHKSGKVITAAHVVDGCTAIDIRLIDYRGETHLVEDVIISDISDLTILTVKKDVVANTLELSTKEEFTVGSQVSTWGFPGGYRSYSPLLLSGYLSGTEMVKLNGDKRSSMWVVNSAFNNGNSGGPLLDIESGKVIGVVSSKLSPLPRHIKSSLEALKNQKSWMIFNVTYKDGRKEQVSQAQIIEEILQYLRSQTQLVIGYAVMIGDLKEFLRENGIDP